MTAETASPLVNALTIDVEDYFQVSAFAPHIRRSEWNTRECRIERNVGRILEMLAVQNTKATFFTLGWIAERYPQLVRQIVEQGHELASHGYGHERASDLTEVAFFADIHRAKVILEDLGGAEVKGYRAPSFSIGTGNLWAFDCLARAGYRYSSSVYPIRHDHYGMPDSPRFAYQVRPGLLEIPVTTLRALGRNLPSMDQVSVIHGDYRSGNFLFDEATGRITAWLDWERGHLGDRHRDLAWITQAMFGDPREDGQGYYICGLLGEQEFYQQYQALSGLTIDPVRLEWYSVLNCYQALVSTLGSCYRVVRLGKNHQDALMVVLKAEGAMASARLQEMLEEVI